MAMGSLSTLLEKRSEQTKLAGNFSLDKSALEGLNRVMEKVTN